MKQLRIHQTSSSQVNDISTTNQLINILARQSFQDLPTFNGKFQDWLTFINYYNSTKESFTMFENHGRLLKSLQGAARDSVDSLLTDPKNVPKVIEMLQFRFGRSETLIRTLIAKVRSISFN